MSFRSLLVILDPPPGAPPTAADAAIQAALDLARALEAAVRGVSLADRPPSPRAASRCEAFLARCRAAGVNDAEAEVIDEDEHALHREAHAADLVVLASPGADGAALSVAEALLVGAARPVLAVPAERTAGPLGANVLAAWDDSPEAARALRDALPFLHRALHVHVLHCTDCCGTEAPERSLEPVFRWLRRHDLCAVVHDETTPSAVAATLLARAADLEADLLVMGAFGRSPGAEHVIGGPTLDVLRRARIPVLFSH